ncbi:MAG: metal-independent alpha-mannosidase [Pseudopedobacter saltans]|uniref:Metal-independent alpha-mannosidase n=1 Tax=Pseudopedobacter saltans TaxID=151895 RepID=A0A2W5ETM2_9SPHI|nr:MAG: metal-independent alpha-mannosidase [Pseudopedobacter saltans]
MERRNFLKKSLLASGSVIAAQSVFGRAMAGSDFPIVRIPEAQRRFKSPAVEKLINEIKTNIGNKELAWIFENCFPNTLDTTVEHYTVSGKSETYVITGDIDAMWLRDSSAQVWPYIPLCKTDKELAKMIEGVINKQVKCILLDPYANAFYKDGKQVSEWASDLTDMKPGVHERKWEIDSLCYSIRLAHGYWKETGSTAIFSADWDKAMELIIQTFKEQQRILDDGPYHFQRKTEKATDTLPMSGYGYPTNPNGLICSMFRPSDDATVFPYLIPSNIFAIISLQNLAEIWESRGKAPELARSARELARTVWQAVQSYGTTFHPKYGKIYAFEANGYGSFNLMDDGNIPSLLSLPYLTHSGNTDDVIYQNTRKYVLSTDNPFFYKGSAAEGIGSPHTGKDQIWHLGIIMRALTSNNKEEIAKCLKMIQTTHAGTGFMHESFDKDIPMNFSRKWFAWANTLCGELIWKVYRENKTLLD